MKKFKHTNADLEMARILTERENARGRSDTGRGGGGDAGKSDNKSGRKDGPARQKNTGKSGLR